MCVKTTVRAGIVLEEESRTAEIRKMSFASDQLYKGYLRRKMPSIVSKVKVREIVPHLPCLTDHDRETIEAKRETSGNFNGMMLLLDCLKRRENWPEQFIAALEACDHPTIAAEIRAEYNALKGNNNSSPGSPPTTVVTAHVHPAPSASHLSVPESVGNSQAAVTPPVEASAARASSPDQVPVQPQPPQSSAVPEAVPPPEPVAEPAHIEVAPAPSTPPPSPETLHTQATTTPPPQSEINSHQEPVENSESDIQGISGVIPDPVIPGSNEVWINSPQPSRPVQQGQTDSPTRPDPRQTTTTTEVRPPQSPPSAQMNSDVSDGSSFPIMTPEKPPVQDTTPPVDIKPAAVQQPEETSEPHPTQVLESSPQRATAAASSPLLSAARMDASLSDDDDSVLLSKPGQLISIHPQNHGSPTLPAPSSLTEPYSGDSERLEISDPAQDTMTSAHIPACSDVSSNTVNTTSALPCQENGITLNHNEPEENHYESPCQSFASQEVRTNVVQISEEVSILNLDGQSVNGEAAKEITSSNSADSVPSATPPSSENHHPSEPAPEQKTLQDSKKTSSPTVPAKYVLTAAGVCACALLMAWKFKN